MVKKVMRMAMIAAVLLCEGSVYSNGQPSDKALQAQLVGKWKAVEMIYGEMTVPCEDSEGLHFLNFNADGTMTAEANGEKSEPGYWRVEGGKLYMGDTKDDKGDAVTVELHENGQKLYVGEEESFLVYQRQ
jgi:hypothetical protein